MSNAPESDWIDHLLTPSPAEIRDDAGPLRSRLLVQTLRLLRWLRWRQRLALAAALAACYLAGVWTVYAVRPAPQPASVAEAARQEPPTPHSSPRPAARALEWQALDGKGPAPDLYRQAGSQYLSDEVDPRSAARCYGQALDQGGDEDLTISPTDDWLLIAIKQARRKERIHAKHGG
jgi:hypothetical protein